jgi:hypothetical protein
MNMMAVDPRGQDTATVVIAVGTGTTNLALGKPATQSSTYETKMMATARNLLVSLFFIIKDSY